MEAEDVAVRLLRLKGLWGAIANGVSSSGAGWRRRLVIAKVAELRL